MLSAFFFAGGITAENKFQQYEQPTAHLTDVNKLNFGEYFAMPFGYRAFTYFGRGVYMSPYFGFFSDDGHIGSEQPSTTYVAKDEYTFDFGNKNFKKP